MMETAPIAARRTMSALISRLADATGLSWNEAAVIVERAIIDGRSPADVLREMVGATNHARRLTGSGGISADLTVSPRGEGGDAP